MDTSIRAGVYGFLIAVVINLFLPWNLYFVPSFLVAILLIYLFRLETLKDGLMAAFITYIFTDGILSTITLATYYFSNESYPSFNVDAWIMLSPVVELFTAVIAGYIGVWLAQKSRPVRESAPPLPPQLPPV
jgi:hypothetical protein